MNHKQKYAKKSKREPIAYIAIAESSMFNNLVSSHIPLWTNLSTGGRPYV